MSNKKQTAKVVCKFNNGEKMEIAILDEGADFSMSIKQPNPNPEMFETTSSITFTSPGGETFEISVELSD